MLLLLLFSEFISRLLFEFVPEMGAIFHVEVDNTGSKFV